MQIRPQQTRKPLRGSVLVAGGATAGHLMPGLAIAGELTAQGWPKQKIHFVGSARGMDSQTVPAAGFGLTALGGRGLNTGGGLARNAVSVARLAWATLRGVVLVGRTRPPVVLCLGGYAALPAAVGAVVWRRPLVIAEQNALASRTNRVFGRFAKAAAVPAAGTGLRREVTTGNPVRPEVCEAAGRMAQTRSELGWPAGATIVVVFGGSLGSLRINSAVWGAVEELAKRDNLFVHHIVGDRDWDARPGDPVERDATAAVSRWYNTVRYDERLPLGLAAADVVACRAGGSTVAELAVLGTPAVLVPLPITSDGHQRRNAEQLSGCGQARIVDDAQFTSERFIAEIDSVMADTTDTSRTPRSTFGRSDSASRIVNLLTEHGSLDLQSPVTSSVDQS